MRQDNILGFEWRFNLRIRSVPGNNTLPRTISAMMQPTDQTSTEKWNDNHQISMQDWKNKKNKQKNNCNNNNKLKRNKRGHKIKKHDVVPGNVRDTWQKWIACSWVHSQTWVSVPQGWGDWLSFVLAYINCILQVFVRTAVLLICSRSLLLHTELWKLWKVRHWLSRSFSNVFLQKPI